MAINDDIHPLAPAGGGGAGTFSGVGPIGLNGNVDRWMVPGPLGLQQTRKAVDLRLVGPWMLSNQGMTFIAVWESGVLNGKFRGLPVQGGFILQVYDDHPENPRINKPTVGLGHVVQKEDKLKTGDKISLEKAREFFEKSIERVEVQVNKKILVPLYQYEYDAVASVAFNSGEFEGLNGLADFINKGNYDDTPAFIRSYRAKTEGKLKRRKSEANLFGGGGYDATH